MGVEPTLSAWEAGVLPINYIRTVVVLYHCRFVFSIAIERYSRGGILFMVLFWICVVLLLLAVALTAGLYFFIFFNHPDKHKTPVQYLDGQQYAPYRELYQSYIDEIAELPCKRIYIRSFDGLKLSARYYETAPGAPVDILMHGYRACAAGDFAGIFQILRKLGHNLLLVDERACGKSEGVTVTFGIKEREDCLSWVRYVLRHYGEDTKIILYGVSMGAATVMMAAGLNLPDNVIGIIEDCGYSSPAEIICKVAENMGLPAKLLYPFARLGARVFGGFDLEADSPEEALRHAKVPVLFIHGYQDGFVPYSMMGKVFDACGSDKSAETFDRGEHAVSCLSDPWKYEQVVNTFIKRLTT